MKRYITLDDIVDSLHKLQQRGLGFILSKLNMTNITRTEQTFDLDGYESSDWWTIPKVNDRINTLITGDATVGYEEYLVNTFLKGKKNLKLISLGSGSCEHEITLAKYANFEEIICIDITKNRLLEAEQKAKDLNLTNIKFICADVNNYEIPKGYYDIVFFHAALHHFDNIANFAAHKVKDSLQADGLLVINEFVGATRLQFPEKQLETINEGINSIPKIYKVRHKSGLIKRKFYGPGFWRMIVADPSECIDSKSILPAIHTNFEALVEKPYGGNILMSALKDISHHFIHLDAQKTKVLEDLFMLEDKYITHNTSDFIFGVYRKK